MERKAVRADGGGATGAQLRKGDAQSILCVYANPAVRTINPNLLGISVHELFEFPRILQIVDVGGHAG